MNQQAIENAKKTISSKGKRRKIIGIVLLALFALGIIGDVSKIASGKGADAGSILIGLMFGALGIWLLLSGLKNTKLVKRYNEYFDRLMRDPEHSIDKLVTKVGKPADEVKKDLTNMIELGLFPGCYVDSAENRLVLPSTKAAAAVAQATGSARMVVRACPGCGAKVSVPAGGVEECEFCGTKVSG